MITFYIFFYCIKLSIHDLKKKGSDKNNVNFVFDSDSIKDGKCNNFYFYIDIKNFYTNIHNMIKRK